MPKKGTTKKKSAKKTQSRPSAPRKSAEKRTVSQGTKQVRSILTFALALFLFAVTLIEGGNAWRFLHNALFGLFGVCTYVVPVAIGAVAVLSALDRLNGDVRIKLPEAAVLVVLIDSAVDIFTANFALSFSEHIKNAYFSGAELKSGGFFGALIGHPLYICCGGKTGAAVIIFILIFVFLLLMTGTTLINFFRALGKPVKKLERAAAESYELREETEEEEEPENPRSPFKREKKVKLPKKLDSGEKNVDIFMSDEEERKDSEERSRKKRDKMLDLYHGIAPEEDSEAQMTPEEAAEAALKALSEPENEASETAPEEQPESSRTEVDFELPINSEHSETTDSEDSEESALPDAEETESALREYKYPPVTLLNPVKAEDNRAVNTELESTGKRLVEVLSSFGVETKIINISRGPAVTRYELKPSVGVKISKITNLSDDIALNLATAGVRIEAPIPNKPAVGIEVPNRITSTVGVREIIDSPVFTGAKSKLTVALGKDIAGAVTVTDIAKMPHGLIAGATGSGKSVCINSIIISLLYKANPEEVKLLLIDPKVVELGIYNGIPHLLIPVVTDPRKAAGSLGWAVLEMEKRYKLFAENDVRNIDGYNGLAEHREDLVKMPHIVIIIDELADLMMTAPGDVEDAICRIAQKARAAGMHLIVATQRPSVDVVTGLIKANIPTRIAFAVSSQIDSRTILDIGGAEKLMGRGDMLFYPVGANKPVRIQGCFVSDAEVESVVGFIKNSGKADYSDDIAEEIERLAAQEKGSKGTKASEDDGGDDADPMLSQAIEAVVEAGQASTSLLQRRLKLGYARAARIIDQMEARGIVGPYQGSKPREVLVSKDRLNEMKMRSDDEVLF